MQQRARVFRKAMPSLAPTVALVAGLLVAMWFLGQTSHASPTATAEQETLVRSMESPYAETQASAGGSAYLPLVRWQFPPPPPIFGTEIGKVNPQNASLAADAGVHWVRHNTFDWAKIEPIRNGTYDWSTVDEVGLKSVADQGMQVIATVKFTPEWAQKVPGKHCGPIKEDALDEYAQFLTALVKRYSAPPYNVRYWELGNEPDVAPQLVPSQAMFGCWGDETDPYYGGGYYAKMLKAAYPAIKEADPWAEVLIGGLLLDCDPAEPPPGKDCKSAKFLEGILRVGGGDFFDVVSFHGYPLYDGTRQVEETLPSWIGRGGVVLGKIDFLREVMASYGVDKPLMHTEGALLCHPNSPVCNSPDSAFFEAQADYVVWLFVRNWAEGLKATIWYTFEGPGWRHGSLLDENQQPKPAYDALKFLSQELADASYKTPITRYSGLLGYEFSAPGKRIWVMWAPGNQPQTIALPEAPQKVYDKYGEDITPEGNTISVQSPIYVESAP